MAPGDIFQMTGSIGGQTTITVSLPSGTKIVVSAAGTRDPGNTEFGFDDGTNASGATHFNDPSDTDGMGTRPLFGDGVDPRISNNTTSSEGYHIAGREV